MTAQPDPYVRVYYRIADDPRFESVYGCDAALAAWLRLLILADAVYPASAPLPRSVKPSGLRLLQEAGLVELLPRGQFRIHGLEKERERRSAAASQSAQLRWNRPPIEGGRPASRSVRFKVLERDGYRCRYCGRTSQEVAIDVDHIRPVREGGTDDLDNLVAACVDCNVGKSGHPLRAQAPQDARASEPHMLSDPIRSTPIRSEPTRARARGELTPLREAMTAAGLDPKVVA